jgi:HAD superfamily hydrolase (TIGR01484 family)
VRPLAHLSAKGVRALLFDIDDTLTTAGKLGAAAYAALERLMGKGLIAVAVSGRPAGWCDHIARMWPVDAVVGENGAFYFFHDAGRLHKRYWHDDEMRRRHREKLHEVGRRILAAVPGCALASDQPYRESDLAIDYCEDVPPLPLAEAQRIAELMRGEGLRARLSSIHVNGWIGEYDKLAMARRLFTERFGVELDTERDAVIYVGDSPNDAPMFEYFTKSVGVANVRRFADLRPKYVTVGESGAGFVELAEHLLRA